MKIYLAAPFFCERELENYRLALAVLRGKGLEVYAPLSHQRGKNGVSRRAWAEATFQDDVSALSAADAVVMLFYGMYSDSGTAWECGYAFASGKKVIAVHLHEGRSNCMINCSCHANLKGLEELAEYDFSALPAVNYYG